MTNPLPRYCAYVPCFNNAATLRRAVDSVLAQSVAPAATIVIDDGSTDRPTETIPDPGVRVIRHPGNLGRGAARARAMAEAGEEFVLCCDATNALERDFAAKALPWFGDSRVAAVFGVFRAGAMDTAAQRWRGRHLFKVDAVRQAQRDALLATTGAMVRRSAIAAVGGYDATLRHSEDADLGRRLLARGYAVVCDPALGFVSTVRNTVPQVLERYWRWHAGTDEGSNWRGYGKIVAYSIKVMAAQDLRARDPLAAAISLACPHYQFWKSRARSWKKRAPTT